MLVADGHALQAVDFLDFVHQISLQFLFAEDRENVMRVQRSIHQRIAGAQTLAFLYVDVRTAGHRVLALIAVVGGDVDFALALGDFAEANHAVNLADDGRLTRLARFEQFHHARQTAGDVLGTGRLLGDLGKHIARTDLGAVLDHQVSSARQQVALVGLGVLDEEGRLALFVGRIAHHPAGETGDFVDLFVEGDAFLQILEADRAADFSEDRVGVRIPLGQQLAQLDGFAIPDAETRTVDHLVALLFAATVVHNRERARAVHGHQHAVLAFNGVQVEEAHEAVVLGVEARLVLHAAGSTADVEGTHGELGARLADGLRGDNAAGLAELDHAAGAEVAAVAERAHAAARLAGEHRADLDLFHARALNGGGDILVDLLVDVDHDVAVVVLDALERNAANDAVAHGLDNLAGLNDGADVDAFAGAAIHFGDDDVLRHVDQAAGQVAGVSGLQSRIGQALTRAVGRDEVLEHREAFAEVGGNRRLDDFARGLGHQTAHTAQLANLLFGTAGAGVGHDVDRIHGAFLVSLLHVAEHLVGNLVGDGGPHLDDLVGALAVGDGAVHVLLLDFDHLLVCFVHHGVLGGRDHHVVQAHGEAGLGGVIEAERLDAVQHAHRHLKAEVLVAIVDQLADALLLEQAVDERHAGRQGVVEDDAADGGRQELLVEVDRLGVGQVLVVVGRGHVEHLAGVAQADRREGLDFLGFQGHQNFFRVGERAAFANAALLGLGQIVEAEHHVLRGHGNRVAGGRRQNVVRGQHQYAGFHLRLGRQGNVHGHLVAVKVGVEGGADQRVNLDGLAFHQHRLKSLNAQTMKGWGAVQQHRVVLDDFLKDVPHHRLLHLHHFLGLLDGGAVARLLQTVIDEGLEQLKRHLLGQAALVQLEIGTDHDDRTAGVVHALAEQVLAEAALLALEGIGERLERAVVGATQHTAAAAVVEQSVDGFLQHALFVAHNDFRRVQIHQLLQPVVAVDNAAVEIVQIGRGKAAAIQRHQGAQLGRNDRQHVENHPLRLVAGLAESLNDLEALGELDLLLRGGLGLHALAQLDTELVDVDALEQFLDGLGAHHGLEAGGAVLLIELAIAILVLDNLALAHAGRIARIDDHVGLEVEHAFEIAQRDVEQVADARRQALEEPHMRAGRSQLNVAHALAAHLADGDFDAALVADDAAVLHALVLAAQALPVSDRSKDAGAEQAVAFRLEGAVVDGFGLRDLAMRPRADLLRRGKHDADGVEIGNRARKLKRVRTEQGDPPWQAFWRCRGCSREFY